MVAAGALIAASVVVPAVAYADVATTTLLVSATEKPLTASPNPTISGVRRVGHVLTATTGTWTPTVVKLAFRWKRNGVGIWGAASKTYTLVKADAGTKITVVVTGSKSGYSTVSRVSAASSIEKLLTAAPVPTVTGVAATARRLTAHPGAWGPSPVQLGYKWQRNGIAIPGATASTYVPSGPDIGKHLSVVVRGTKPGYTPKSRVSAETAAIVLSIAIPGDGTYRMGYGLSAGTYVTRTATENCYWQRVSEFEGAFDSIIVSNFGSGQRIVTIAAGDAGFVTDGCGSWIRLKDSTGTARSTVPNVGVFAVGIQIRPGLYSAPGGDGCNWETLSGFHGDVDSIISNDFSWYTGQLVSIDSRVVGFETDGCGTWTRIGD
jgi:hypothetical protein